MINRFDEWKSRQVKGMGNTITDRWTDEQMEASTCAYGGCLFTFSHMGVKL